MSDTPSRLSQEFTFFTSGSLRRKLLWFINLRWIASAGALLYVLILDYFFPETTQMIPLLICTFLLVFFNSIYLIYTRSSAPRSFIREERFLFVQLLMDMSLLTSILHFSGGVENPLYFFFIFYIIITSIITDRPSIPFIVAGIDCILFTFMALGEYFGLIQHYHLALISHSSIITVFALVIFYITVFVSAYISTSLIARHRKVKDLIVSQKEMLERTSKEKTRFFRFVSHELKAPIVAIESSANVLTEILHDKTDKNVQNLAKRIRVRTRQMLSIIKDLMDISHDQTKGLKTEPVDPCEFVNASIELEKQIMLNKNISLKVDTGTNEKGVVLDKYKLEKIFSNILGNAIRYTPEGGQISVSSKIRDRVWILTVQDSGIGISEEDLPRIFEESYRARNARETEPIGTGLGLNIVKKFVDDMTGTVSITSRINEGTTVTIRIPVDE